VDLRDLTLKRSLKVSTPNDSTIICHWVSSTSYPKRDRPNSPRGSTGRGPSNIENMENRGTRVFPEPLCCVISFLSVSFVLLFFFPCVLDDTIMTWCLCAIVYTYTPVADFSSTMFKHLQYPHCQLNMKSNQIKSTYNSKSNMNRSSVHPRLIALSSTVSSPFYAFTLNFISTSTFNRTSL
jgi:hypothetical protein